MVHLRRLIQMLPKSGPTFATNRRISAPGVVGKAASLGAAAQFIGPIAEVLQGNQDVVGPIHQEAVPVGRLWR